MIEKKMLRRDIRARLSSISYDKKVECDSVLPEKHLDNPRSGKG